MSDKLSNFHERAKGIWGGPLGLLITQATEAAPFVLWRKNAGDVPRRVIVGTASAMADLVPLVTLAIKRIQAADHEQE